MAPEHVQNKVVVSCVMCMEATALVEIQTQRWSRVLHTKRDWYDAEYAFE